MDERAQARLVVDRTATCRTFNGREQIRIYDLSTSGCLVARRSGRYALGETVLITLVGNAEVAGEVVWSRPPHAGVRFTKELSERIVAYLGFKHRSRSAAGAGDKAD